MQTVVTRRVIPCNHLDKYNAIVFFGGDSRGSMVYLFMGVCAKAFDVMLEGLRALYLCDPNLRILFLSVCDYMNKCRRFGDLGFCD